jgi:hypothetical protein
VSPILVRPVREQLEHDRVIRLLQAKYKRKFDVAINPGHERAAPVGPPAAPWYPDLVLHGGNRGKRLAGVVEVETLESLNHLEAMSQWVAFSKLRVAFHLYVPSAGIDSARRLCAESKVAPAELWAYQAFGEQIRFTMVSRGPQSGARARTTAATPARARSTRTTATAARATAAGTRGPAAGTRAKARTGAVAKSAKKKAAPAPRAAKAARPRRATPARTQKRK